MKEKMFFYVGRVSKLNVARLFFLLTLPFILLITLTCNRDLTTNEPADGNPATGNGPIVGASCNDPQYCWGHPNKLDLTRQPVSNDELFVAFGLIADVHLDATRTTWKSNQANDPDATLWGNSTRMHNNRSVVYDMNLDCKTTGAPHVENDCLGIILLGDMLLGTRDKTYQFTQQLVAFRQLYEYDYTHAGTSANSGGLMKEIEHCESYYNNCNDRYSLGYRIQFPVIPMLGNHDVNDNDENKTSGYITQRVSGAPGLLSEYNHTNFMWRWGRYLFVALGLWAGSFNWQNTSPIDYGKLDWLRDNLAKYAPDSSIGVLIFQHYGWDGGESNQERYWTQQHKQMELNVLAGKSYNDNTGPCKPYNIIGIFTGHNHWPQEQIMVNAGTDTKGNAVNFENFVMMSASGNSGNKAYGFSVVRLTGNKMYIHTKDKNPDLGGNGRYWPVLERNITIKD